MFSCSCITFRCKETSELGSGLGLGISNFRKSYKDGLAIDVTPGKEKELDKENTEKVTADKINSNKSSENK